MWGKDLEVWGCVVVLRCGALANPSRAALPPGCCVTQRDRKHTWCDTRGSCDPELAVGIVLTS